AAEMLGFAILLGFNTLGVLVQTLLSLPLPGNVIGLILFILALSLKWIRLEWVESTSQLLVKHMMLFFAPLIVGVVSVANLIGHEWLIVTAGIVISTLLTLIITGASSQLLLKKG